MRLLVLAPTAALQAADLLFTHITVDAEPPDKPYYKMAGDVDGDGKKDIVVAGNGKSLVWYAHPSWEKTEIAQQGWSGVNGEIADIDGDGDQDIVMGSVVWFRNPGKSRSSRGGSWERMQIGDQRIHDIEVGDMDQDGRLDVVARDQSAFRRSESEPGGSAIFIYYQAAPNTWTKQKIDCPHGEGVKLADSDQDGDLDILIGARWYENTLTGTAGRWPEHVYAREWAEPDAKVEAADINGDGRHDIVLTPSELRGENYKVAWYEQPATGAQGEWAEHVIIPEIESVIHALDAGDLDGDGDIDIAIAEMHQGEDPDEVIVLLNEDAGSKWHRQVISNNGSHDIVIADIDGDGDQDIFGANHSGVAPVELWRNDGIAK